MSSRDTAVYIDKHDYEISAHYKNVKENIYYTKKPNWQKTSQLSLVIRALEFQDQDGGEIEKIRDTLEFRLISNFT